MKAMVTAALLTALSILAPAAVVNWARDGAPLPDVRPAHCWIVDFGSSSCAV